MKMPDLTLAQMMIVNPMQPEVKEFKNRILKTMRLWRELNISVTTKAHLIEYHALHQLEIFKGIMDKAEHQVE